MSAMILWASSASGHVSMAYTEGFSVRNANSPTGDGRHHVGNACGNVNDWGANGNSIGLDGMDIELNINYAAGHDSPNNVFEMAYSCDDTTGNAMNNAQKLTTADGCTCTSAAGTGYPCDASDAIQPGGYTIKCTLPTQNLAVGEEKQCTVALLDQRNWGGCTDVLMQSAAATLPPAPPPAPIVPNDGVYDITRATSIDTSASTFTCCPLEAAARRFTSDPWPCLQGGSLLARRVTCACSCPATTLLHT